VLFVNAEIFVMAMHIAATAAAALLETADGECIISVLLVQELENLTNKELNLRATCSLLVIEMLRGRSEYRPMPVGFYGVSL
jgi:hypothetical protein